MKGNRPWVTMGFVSLSLLFVVSSDPAWAVDLREGLDQMVAQLAKGAPEGKQFRVAVADFPDLQGVISDLGRFIANRITTRLVQNPKFSVIERQRLTQVLGELKFSMSDLVDPDKAKQLGRMVGVEGLVVGAVSDLGNQVDIDARMIEIESNKMLLGAIVTISKDEVVQKMLERGREIPAPPVVGATPMSSTPAVALGTVKYQEFAKFRVEVEGIQVGQKGGVIVFLSYTNKTQEELNLLLGSPRQNTFLVDNEGNGFHYSSSSGLSGSYSSRYPLQIWDGQPMVLSPGIRATVSFIFYPPREMGRKGRLFSFTSEQALVKQMGDKKMMEGQFNISIRNIEPR